MAASKTLEAHSSANRALVQGCEGGYLCIAGRAVDDLDHAELASKIAKRKALTAYWHDAQCRCPAVRLRPWSAIDPTVAHLHPWAGGSLDNKVPGKVRVRSSHAFAGFDALQGCKIPAGRNGWQFGRHCKRGRKVRLGTGETFVCRAARRGPNNFLPDASGLIGRSRPAFIARVHRVPRRFDRATEDASAKRVKYARRAALARRRRSLSLSSPSGSTSASKRARNASRAGCV